MAVSGSARDIDERAGVLLEARTIRKSFGPTRALRGCTFSLRAGEVHALLGENGSGKSTLMKVLTGVQQPDDGQMLLLGERVAPRDPREAIAAGVVAVYQEVLGVPSQTVVENIWMGADGVFRSTGTFLARRERAAQALVDLLDEPPGLDTRLEQLPLSVRQACAVARAVVREPRVLILDEATSALDVATRDHLFALLRRLCQNGVGVVFISHRMDEVEEIADRISVLRSGEVVATVERGEASSRELVRMMTGADHLADRATASVVRSPIGGVVLRADDLRLAESAAPIDVEIRAGEIVGVAGLEGHGQEPFLKALAGASAPTGGRVVRVDSGSKHELTSQRVAKRCGVAYVPRDRRTESLFEALSVGENFRSVTLELDRVGRALSARRASARLNEYVRKLNIRVADTRDPITTLSGGNQQKVVIARWLAASPRVLILNDPTRGVDIGAKREIYALLVNLASEGVAIVMNSTEVDEQLELMDRVLVFREYSLFCELPREGLTRDGLVSAFFGRTHSESDSTAAAS